MQNDEKTIDEIEKNKESDTDVTHPIPIDTTTPTTAHSSSSSSNNNNNCNNDVNNELNDENKNNVDIAVILLPWIWRKSQWNSKTCYEYSL